MNIRQNKFIKQTIIVLSILFVLTFFYSTFVVAQTEQPFVGWIPDFQGEESQTDEMPKAGKLLCNKNSFYLFLALFTEDTEFQFSSARYPLKITRTEPGIPEDYVTNKYYSKIYNLHGEGLFPNYQQRLADNLKYTVKFPSGKNAEVVLNREDSGVSIFYIFEWNGFWELIEINDYST